MWPRKGGENYGKNRKSAEVDLAILSLADLDAIAQESYAEMLRLAEAGKAGEIEYLRASVRYAQAAVEYYRRVNAAELMQRYNQISDAFGLDAAETLVK